MLKTMTLPSGDVMDITVSVHVYASDKTARDVVEKFVILNARVVKNSY